MQSLEFAASRNDVQVAVEKATQGETLKSARENISRVVTSVPIAEYQIPAQPKDLGCSRSILRSSPSFPKSSSKSHPGTGLVRNSLPDGIALRWWSRALIFKSSKSKRPEYRRKYRKVAYLMSRSRVGIWFWFASEVGSCARFPRPSVQTCHRTNPGPRPARSRAVRFSHR